MQVRPSRLDEFFEEHSVQRAVVLFGSSIIAPKESYVFRFHMPEAPIGYSVAANSTPPKPIMSSRLLAAATRKVVKTMITQG